MKCSLKYINAVHRFGDKLRCSRRHPILRACLAECIGTCVLVIFGCGVLAQVILGNNGNQEWGTFISISLGWGIAVTLGVLFAGVSGSGHINPALSVAFGLVGRFPLHWIPGYVLSQFLGAFLGAFVIYGIYWEKLAQYAELKNNGTLLMNSTGVIFVTYPYSSATTCFVDQLVCTALLSAGISAISDGNGWRMPLFFQPLYIGLLVYAILGCFSLNVGCALNPARDLGPRLMLLICGWGTAAFSASGYYFWIPLVAPFLGAIIGAFLYEATIGIHYTRPDPHRAEHLELQHPPAEARNLLP